MPPLSDFNPRSHEGSDQYAASKESLYSDFNPRSHEGSDASWGPPIIDFRRFQSTLPRGERQLVYNPVTKKYEISIHAPTRGATASAISYLVWQLYFNPRSHEGSDGRKFISVVPDELFQSTLPRGERHSEAGNNRGIRNDFNPRSHEGSDAVQCSNSADSEISIHAPTRGATRRFGGRYLLQ